ncbi:hypothetical protein DVR12_05020 [Chitinophaga silvatica]|uniref:Signal transduction histidine kinase n=1 Tax=Chitinophaga silvatica TaxID=2282649 RepID=A0A3E1YDJ8_9BACT|nr:tetratricopeptide repeat protein [Chitinophaga silvatica]RFS24569.1 hypothetical protein DVR12_05020 [Chitinophaga silvatica]
MAYVFKTSFRSCVFTIICLILILPVSNVKAQRNCVGKLYKQLVTCNDSIQLANTLGAIAVCYQFSETDSSIRYATEQLKLAAKINYKAGKADAYDVLSDSYALRTDYNLAILYAYQALQLYKELNDSIRVCNSLSQVSNYYAIQGRVSDANNYFYEALKIAKEISPVADSIYGEMLTSYVRKYYGDYKYRDSVDWALKKAIPIGRKYPGSSMSIYLQAYDLDTLLKTGQGHLAEDSINSLATIAIHNNWPLVAIDLYNRLISFSDLGYPTDSIHYQELIFELGKQCKCLELNLAAMAGLFDHYKQVGDTEKLECFTKEILTISSNNRYDPEVHMINFLEYFNKEKSLYQLASSNQLMQSELNEIKMTTAQRKWIFKACIIILMLLVILLISKYRSYHLLKRQQEIQIIKNASVSLAHIKLRANDEFKNKLIAIIANDFSAPLKQISAITGQLKVSDADQVSSINHIKKIAVVARGSLCVFDNILKWVKLQLSGFTYSRKPCKPYEILKGVLKHVSLDIESRNILFVNQIPQQLVFLADAEMLTMVQQHLMQLSIHFTEPGKLLVISAWEDDATSHIRLITEPSMPVSMVIKNLTDWQNNMYALSYAITQDFIQKMEGTLEVIAAEEKYLVFHAMLSKDK